MSPANRFKTIFLLFAMSLLPLGVYAWNVTSVSAGNNHNIALGTNGALWGWGRNTFGQIGDITTVDKNVSTQIGSDANWSKVAAGNAHTVAIKTDGSLWGWGLNSFYQLGDGTTANKTVPIQIGSATTWTNVVAGYVHNAALKSDGTLWTWGRNTYGMLGDGTTTDISTPTQLGVATWSAVFAGDEQTFGIKTAGTLWGWGQNSLYKLGDGTSADKHVPTQIGSASDWAGAKLSTGLVHTAAVKADGTLWAWGGNNNGQIGDGNTTNQPTPIQIGSATNWATVSASKENSHTLAVKIDGTLWAWGSNQYGQLGDGTSTDRLVPTQIGSDTNWASVSAGEFHSIGVKTDGSVWAWGRNTYGQLGNGTHTNKNIPTQVMLPANITAATSHGGVLQLDTSGWVDGGTLSLALHTVEAWVNTKDSGKRIVGYYGSPDYTQMYVDGAGKLVIGSNSGSISGTKVINDGAWHHLAYSCNTSTNYCTGYVDGEQDSYFSHTTGFVPVSGAFHIGGHSGTETAKMQIDEVRVWNTVRTQAEINASMNTQLAGNESGLVTYYRFDEQNGTKVVDSAGFDNNGTLTGSFVRLNFLGDGLNFSGSSSGIQTTATLNCTTHPNFSLAAWVKPTSIQAGWHAIFTQSGSLGIDSDGGVLGNATLTAGQWNHVVRAQSSSNVKYYLNGQVVLDTTPSTCVGDSTPLFIGTHSDWSGSFQGSIAEASIWSKTLTQSEIQNIMDYSVVGNEAYLQGYWKLNEGSGTNVYEYHGAYNGTVTGGMAGTWIKTAPTIAGGSIYVQKHGIYFLKLIDEANLSSYTVTTKVVPLHGTLATPLVFNRLTYTPAANYTGADNFQIEVNQTSTATSKVFDFNITVIDTPLPPVAPTQIPTYNLPPFCQPIQLITQENIPLNGMLQCADDLSQSGLTYQLISQSTAGTATVSSNGGFNFIPTPNFNGTAAFSFQAFDGANYSNTTTVTIRVLAVSSNTSGIPLPSEKSNIVLVRKSANFIEANQSISYSVLAFPVTANCPIASYTASFGDGSSSASATPYFTHSYSADGTYTASFVATDCNGNGTELNIETNISASLTPFTYTLVSGWNLISLPYQGVFLSGDINSTFNKGSNITALFKFKEGAWKIWVPNDDGSYLPYVQRMSSLDSKEGFWVKTSIPVDSNMSLGVKMDGVEGSVNPYSPPNGSLGWNLIGVDSSFSTAADIFDYARAQTYSRDYGQAGCVFPSTLYRYNGGSWDYVINNSSYPALAAPSPNELVGSLQGQGIWMLIPVNGAVRSCEVRLP